MRFLRLSHLLLGLVLLAWTAVNAASKCEEDCKVETQKGFYRERPKCECGSHYYKTCTHGAYYAHTPTMCIYVTRQEFTHKEAEEFCAKRFEYSGFLAFVEDWDESYHISHYVWNDLKQGVEGNETHFWTSGKFSNITRTNATGRYTERFWLYEYRSNYMAEIPATLFPTKDSTRKDAEDKGRHCVAGHTEHYDKLHAKDCSEKFPAVCYYYRETVAWYCPTVHGMVGTLFRGKCYYRYSAPVARDEPSWEKYHKTWFEAREECAKLGAKLASVHDEATQEKLLQLSAGKETVTSLKESTWIGLQKGCKLNERKNNTCDFPAGGCWWRDDERPLLEKNDPDPKNGVDRCRTTFSDAFPGQWEDGELYNHTESLKFWAEGEPNEAGGRGKCGEIKDPQSRAYCLRGVDGIDGESDPREHCAQMFPGDKDQLTDNIKYFAGKWNDYWCYERNRGYVCERPATRTNTGAMKDEL